MINAGHVLWAISQLKCFLFVVISSHERKQKDETILLLEKRLFKVFPREERQTNDDFYYLLEVVLLQRKDR